VIRDSLPAFLDELEKISGISKKMLQIRGTNLSRDAQTYLHNRVNAHAVGRKAAKSVTPKLSKRLELRSWGKANKKKAREGLKKISFLRDVGGYIGNVAQRGAQGAASYGATAAGQMGQAAAAFLTPQKSFQQGMQATFRPGGKPLGFGWKALMGYGLATGARDVMKSQDPSGQGHSRLRRAAKLVGDQAGGIIGAPFGFAGGVSASLIGGKLGDLAGAAADRMRGRKTIPAVPLQGQR
jgi:hypothetical protein